MRAGNTGSGGAASYPPQPRGCMQGVFCLRDVVGNGEQLEGRQRPDDGVDLVAVRSVPAPLSLVPAGLPPVSAEMNSTLRPAKV